MLKKSLMFISLAILMMACNSTATQEAKNEKQETVQVKIADLISNTNVYAENTIKVSAIVKHVCEHGGKKMFLINKETEETIKIITGENMPAFNTDLVGYKVSVTGTIEKLVIDEAYLVEWESELIAAANETEEAEHNHDAEEQHAEEGEHKHAETGSKADQADQGTHEEGMKTIANYRKQISESEQDFIVFYTVVCEKLEKLEKIETAEKE